MSLEASATALACRHICRRSPVISSAMSPILTSPCRSRFWRGRCRCCLTDAPTPRMMCKKASAFLSIACSSWRSSMLMTGCMGMGGHMGKDGGMGMMSSMAHPIHLHGEQFQILERKIDEDHADDYATMRDGFIVSGWKDTVLVVPGERVRLIKPFHDFKGLYMYHCHNLEHEDMGMMRQFSVE